MQSGTNPIIFQRASNHQPLIIFVDFFMFMGVFLNVPRVCLMGLFISWYNFRHGRLGNPGFCSKPGGCIANLFLRFYQIPCRNHRLVGDLHIGVGSCSAGRIIIHSHKLLVENRFSVHQAAFVCGHLLLCQLCRWIEQNLS